MPIVAGDIDYFLSGGATGIGNTDPDVSLGGVITTTQVVDNTDNNIFDDVTGDEAGAGSTEYRAIFVHNAHGSLNLQSAVVWIESNTTSGDDTVNIALADEGVQVNGSIEIIANETTAPATVSFSAPANKGAGLAIGDIAFGSEMGIWHERIVTPGASAITGNAYTIRVEGDTLA
jgi:hypothetical protein